MRQAEVAKGGTVRVVCPAEQILDIDLVEAVPPVVRVVLAIGEEGALRPLDVVRLLCSDGEAAPELAWVHRTALFRRPAGRAGLEPLV
jgi:hypothetical protein